jgi:4-carboxymuconolactone decarboxylase
MESERYQRGLSRLQEVVGAAGIQVIEALQDIAPDMAQYTVEFSYGDVYSRRSLLWLR